MNAHSATFKYKTKDKRNSFTSMPCESIQMGFYGQKAAEWIPLEECQNGLIILVNTVYYILLFLHCIFYWSIWVYSVRFKAAHSSWNLRWLTSQTHFLFALPLWKKKFSCNWRTELLLLLQYFYKQDTITQF